MNNLLFLGRIYGYTTTNPAVSPRDGRFQIRLVARV